MIKSKSWHLRDKAVIAGMSRRIESVYVSQNEYLPAKSTTVVHLPVDNVNNQEIAIKSLVAYLNSPTATELMLEVNGKIGMAGDYITINKNIIKNIPYNSHLFCNKDLAESHDLLVGQYDLLDSLKDKFISVTKPFFQAGNFKKISNSWFNLQIDKIMESLDPSVEIQKREQIYTYILNLKKEFNSILNKIEKLEDSVDKIISSSFE